MIGECKLCRQITTLRDSHYLSKGIYKRLHDLTERNPNPISISRNAIVQTSKQKTAYLLCSDCEQRLSTYGENWVLGHCLQVDGSFPLASILSSKPPYISSKETKVYNASLIGEIDVPALVYFATSIFWRGSIYGWNGDGSMPVSLGPFQEQFRKYLLRLDAFPKEPRYG